MTATILRVAVAAPFSGPLDYLANSDTARTLLPGMRVKVPLGKRSTIGIFLEHPAQADCPLEKIRHIEEIIDAEPILNAELLRLYTWISEYYHYPLGEVMISALPKSLRGGKALLTSSSIQNASKKNNSLLQQSTPTAKPELNAAQQAAVQAIIHRPGFHVSVLAGVTGSGKTEVYLQVIEHILAQGKTAIVLVPEIALTPQTVARFAARFQTAIGVLHSNLTDKQRLETWCQARAGHISVLIGTRSAILAPMKNLSLIVIDESHDTSYKQFSGCRYHAADVALRRAQWLDIPVILGSATPPLQTLWSVQQNRNNCYQMLSLPHQATGVIPPTLHCIDLKKQKIKAGLSPTLLKIMQTHLEKKQQILLFLNQRGYAPTFICGQCGWVAQCDNCDAALTLHQHPRRLICHHCNHQQLAHVQCNNCHDTAMSPLGVGTEKLETVLSEQFPQYRIIRIDGDTTRKKGQLQALLAQAHNHEADILIGTQIITKGHHFKNLGMVAILNVDAGLFSPDFRATENTLQLITQVSGRAGREFPGDVYLQTYHPDHPLLQTQRQQGYLAACQLLLAQRQQSAMPPFRHLALIRAEAKNAQIPLHFLQQLKELLPNTETLELLGPAPAQNAKRANFFRAQLMILSEQRPALHACLNKIKKMCQESALSAQAKKLRWFIDVDPYEL